MLEMKVSNNARCMHEIYNLSHISVQDLRDPSKIPDVYVIFSLSLLLLSQNLHHHSYKEDTLVPNALDSPFPTLCPVLDSLGIATHSLSPQIVRRHCLTLKEFRNMCSVTSSESMMKVKTENVSSNSVSLVVTAKFDSTQKAYNLHCELRT